MPCTVTLVELMSNLIAAGLDIIKFMSNVEIQVRINWQN